MAFPCVSILPLLLLLLITPLSSSLSLSDTITKDSLYQLCTQPTIINHFCIIWLTNDPATFTLNFYGLLGLVTQKTQLFGNKNLAMMKGLVRTTADPTLKIPYGSCVTYYESAIKLMDEAIKFAISKKYELTSQAAGKAFSSINTCEADLAGRNTVPSDVPLCNIQFKRMCNIVRVFSDVLTAKNY